MAEPATLRRRVDQSQGRTPADLLLKNGRVFDLVTGAMIEGDVAICGDTVVGIGPGYQGKREIDVTGATLVPGFIDSHLHIESSLLTPQEFARCVLPRGTTVGIFDPHEIANVLGLEGLRFMLDEAAKAVIDLYCMLPSCVPATHLETAGAKLLAADLETLKDHPLVLGLAEVMNVPAVINADPDMHAKLATFGEMPIDGHAPLVSGRDLQAYASTGVITCHETTTAEEALEKLRLGMTVLFREGGVTKDVAALSPALTDVTSPFCAFCTDDRTPLDIAHHGHLDCAIRVALDHGVTPLAAYRAACWSATRHLGLRGRGLIAPGYRADIVALDDLNACTVRRVFKNGIPAEELIAETVAPVTAPGGNTMHLARTTPETFRVLSPSGTGTVIGARPEHSLLTDALTLTLPWQDGERLPDPDNDVARVCVLCRHGVPNIGRSFVKGFGLRRGALASSVGHDSHNVTVVGVEKEAMAIAVNRLIEMGGGFVAATTEGVLAELAMPVAGLMSDRSFGEVEAALGSLHAAARSLGSTVEEPFLRLAFISLAVIPHIKLTDKGLVNVDTFEIIAA